MARYVKLTVTVREDMYDLITHLMEATGLGRSAAVSLMLSHANIEALFPPAYLRQHPDLLNRVYPVEPDDPSSEPK